MVRKLFGLGRNVRDRVVSPVSLTVIFAVLAGMCLWQGLRSDPVAVRGNTALESSQTTPSTSKYRTQEIRNITLGTWVLADNPELPGDVEGDYGEYDAATWRTIALRMTKDDGAQLDIQLARPLWWIEETHAAVGATIFLDMEEMGAVGDAEVLSIGPCPEITPRPSSRHRLVTGKFVHSSGDFLNLYVDGLDEPIGTTSNHPFWSEDRQQFVHADELTTGERLRLADGQLTQVAAMTERDGFQAAFNLEVDGEHVYFVSSAGVLVHNSYPKGAGKAKYVFNSSTKQYRDVATGRFVSPRDLPWPSNRGFASSTHGTLKPGTIIDRYGKPSGRYAGRPGATVSERGMATGADAAPYTQYEVLKPLRAEMGPAAPVSAFGAKGGAMQYLFSKSISDLITEGFLRAI